MDLFNPVSLVCSVNFTPPCLTSITFITYICKTFVSINGFRGFGIPMGMGYLRKGQCAPLRMARIMAIITCWTEVVGQRRGNMHRDRSRTMEEAPEAGAFGTSARPAFHSRSDWGPWIAVWLTRNSFNYGCLIIERGIDRSSGHQIKYRQRFPGIPGSGEPAVTSPGRWQAYRAMRGDASVPVLHEIFMPRRISIISLWTISNIENAQQSFMVDLASPNPS
ncbi:MAG: hypothetical protein A4E30_01169 [Methanomassiliicoccales archaeon PtaB.Bin215]|nr:MAG: hypothetical protein A4E30_01169 [Methanomassiliicoccales archaeon PtaB.Bin215]